MKIRKLLIPAAIAAALTVLIAPTAFAQQDPQADKKAEEAKKADDAKKAEAKKKADAEKKKSGDRGVEPEEEGDK
jgi:Ni/Co efflux regulator RcnB